MKKFKIEDIKKGKKLIENKKEKYKTLFEHIELLTKPGSTQNKFLLDSIRKYFFIVRKINISIYDEAFLDVFDDLQLLLGMSVFIDYDELEEEFVITYVEHLQEVLISDEYKALKSFLISYPYED